MKTPSPTNRHQALTEMSNEAKKIISEINMDAIFAKHRVDPFRMQHGVYASMHEYARLKSQEENKELVEALREVSPLLDGLINRTPTGKQREELCDMNIKVKSALAAHTPKG